jgi:PAS domain S-box-containing protein
MTGPRNRSSRRAYALVLLAAIVVQALIGLQAWQHWEARDRALAEKKRELGNTVHLLHDATSKMVDQVEMALSEIANLPDAADGRLQSVIVPWAARLEPVFALFVIDRTGRLTYNSNAEYAPSVDLSDHPYFIRHRDAIDSSLRVGAPILSRAGIRDTWLIPISRRIDGGTTRFGGVAVAAIRPDFLGAFYSAIDVGSDGSIALLNADGTVLASAPQAADLVDRTFAGEAIAAMLRAGRMRGSYETAPTDEGAAQLGAFAALATLPLALVAQAGTDRTLATWRRDMRALSIVGVLSAIVSIAFALVLIREFRKRDAAVIAHEASESRFRDFAATASDWLWETDAQHRFSWFSERAFDIGIPELRPIGRTRWEVGQADIDPPKWEAHRATLEARRPFRNFQYSQTANTGALRHIRISGVPVFAEDGAFLGYRGTALDITAEVAARAEADRANIRLLDAIESLSDGFALFNAEDRLVICNRAFADYHKEFSLARPGRSFTEMIELAAKTVVHPTLLGEDPAAWLQWRLQQHRQPGRPIEVRYRDNAWSRVIENRTREGGIVLVRTDITEIKTREAELQTRVAQQNSVALLAQLALDPVDPDRLLAKATDLITRTLNLPVCSVLETTSDGRSFVVRATTGWPREQSARERSPVDDGFQAGYALRHHAPVMSPDVTKETRFKIHPRILERGLRSALAIPIEGDVQTFGVLTCHSEQPHAFTASDINFVQAVANVLANTIRRRQQEARLRAILDNSVDCIFSTDETGIIESANAAVESMFGFTEAELIGSGITRLMPEKFRDDYRTQLERHLATGQSDFVGRVRELEGLRRDGTVFAADFGVREVNLGNRRVFICSIRDASQRKATEEQLRHAQKMEAVGQLTGGIAHDFNNLLTIILGNAEMMQEVLAGDRPALRAMTDTVFDAASRGAALTHRLLAFARKQNLEAAAFDVNELVRGMGDLLRRTLGVHITVEYRLADNLPAAVADRSQLESALLNLAINGRDAMPEGGVLTIETAQERLDEEHAAANDVAAGDYVMLAVTDSGVGMSPDIVARVFEPFFTTKEVGKGTGLGLPMVYGFVKQSGGHVRIDSEAGHGTTVKLFLPIAADGARATEAQAGAPQVPGGRETILVVEDDAEIRRLTTTRLENLGYRVIACADGPAALARLASDEPFDLLFSDVVMPGGLNGRQLAEAARRQRPTLRILLTSGYADAALGERAMSDETFTILIKPYSKRALAERIRAALG